MRLRKLIVGTLFLATTVTSVAEPPTLDTSVKTLLSKFEERKDDVYLALALNRCAALLGVIQGVLKRDANKDVYLGTPERLQDVAWTLIYRKLKERGVNVDDEARQESISNDIEDEFMDFVRAYSSRMEANRKTSGDMWSSDSLITSDLTSCEDIASAVNN